MNDLSRLPGYGGKNNFKSLRHSIKRVYTKSTQVDVEIQRVWQPLQQGWKGIFKTRFGCALHVSAFILNSLFPLLLYLSLLLSSPTMRQRCCCIDGDSEAYHGSHIPDIPAASHGFHGTTVLQEVYLISSHTCTHTDTHTHTAKYSEAHTLKHQREIKAPMDTHTKLQGRST